MLQSNTGAILHRFRDPAFPPRENAQPIHHQGAPAVGILPDAWQIMHTCSVAMKSTPQRSARAVACPFWLPIPMAILGLVNSLDSAAAEPFEASSQSPPPLAREFRGAWVATVYNIDWPSKAGLPSSRQQAELVSLVDRAADLKLNAIVFQVRPGCDALYPSNLEPWSQWLSGRMGRPPEPAYDPLELAVRLAHERGMELHAWFNPFRAMPNREHPACPTHVSRARPDLTRRYSQYLWLDPGDPQVREHSLKVILDVVRRYDIDGVHLDDYFYPYPARSGNGGTLPFPDDATWQKYRALGGKLGRAEWRRSNVDELVQRLQAEIHKAKPWVKFGISPFGVWRPGYPSSVHADIDAYEDLGADSRRWLQQGWIDYLAPQLYWSIDAPKQSFPALLDWWLKQNPRQRHLWPGVADDRIGKSRPASEIIKQIKLVRERSPASSSAGHLHWSIKHLLEDRRGIATLLKDQLFTDRAIVPESAWLPGATPGPPSLASSHDASGTRLTWNASGGARPWLWAVQTLRDGRWETRVHSADKNVAFWKNGTALPERVAVTAIDRTGRAGKPSTVERGAAPASAQLPRPPSGRL